MPYDINEHSHRFAAWSAGRAASVKGARFGVEMGRTMLEAAGLTATFYDPQQLPEPQTVDRWHRQKRLEVMEASGREKLTHGVAAKLLNVYLKARFVCSGHADHPNVMALHPPVDEMLLDAMFDGNIGGLRQTTWKMARKARWSKFSSDEYEEVVRGIRRSLNGQSMWMIEEHWRGHQ